MHRPNFSTLLPVALLFGVLGYLIPWVVTPASSLSLGAYDLAEWASLHPIVRQTVPFLWTVLMLRLPLAILGLLLAIYIVSTLHRTILGLTLILITAIALLPPLEFFTVYNNDPNYQQQFILVLITLLIGIVATTWQNKWLKRTLPALLSTLGFLFALIGLYQGYILIQNFNLLAHVGYGGVITVISLGAASYLYITKQSSQTTLFAMGIHTNTAA